MSGFNAISSYNPILVLLLGLATYIGFSGLGLLVLKITGFSLENPWRQVVAVSLGILIFSLVVQIFAMLGLASPLLLAVQLIALIGVGGVAFFLIQRPIRAPFRAVRKPLEIAALVLLLGIALVNVLAAMAPSSKHDELYYHMLVPSRILSDGAMLFYRKPWESSVMPQMIYQIGTTPLHAVGFPDAANVVSSCLSLTLAWFAYSLIVSATGKVAWSMLWAAALLAGMYTVVWHVTGGGHALGDLCMAASVVALIMRDDLIRKYKYKTFLLIVSILALSAAATKVSLLPLSFAILGLAFVSGLKAVQEKGKTWKAFAAVSGPWVVFYLPILIWTYAQSGSPFGPLLSGFFPKSIFETGTAASIMASTKQAAGLSPYELIRNTFAGYSPLVWIAFVGVLFLPTISGLNRLIMLALGALQIVVICVFLFVDHRFLGGIHYGFAILFALFSYEPMRKRLAPAVTPALLSLLVLPLLAIQIYYARQFFGVSLGLQNKMDFYREKVALVEDYLELDEFLPEKAFFFVPDRRISSIYSPRPVFFDKLDLPGRLSGQDPRANLYLLVVGDGRGLDELQVALPKELAVGSMIYENPAATVEAYRTPGRKPSIDTLRVFAVEER